VIIFIEEDEAYLHWIDDNQSGFVVNTYRRPSPAYLVLHRAICPRISTAARTNWTTKQYIKVCSADLSQLRDWAQRELTGDLKPCSFCCRELRAPPPLDLTPPLISVVPAVSEAEVWRFWRPGTELAILEDFVPLKASWEKSTDPSQVRLRDYRQQVRDSLLTTIGNDRLYLDLRVGLAESVNLLDGNDLENYLTPLFECGCLPAMQFRLVTAEKLRGGKSRLAIGIAEPAGTSSAMRDYCHFSIYPTAKPSNDRVFKTELHSAIAACGHSILPDGEVEMHVVWRCALSRRSWFRLWKSTGDSLGPILGAYERKNQFDPRDDRITKLAFQFLPDESLGDRLQIGIWWRMR
jgi:hypothetical protein